MSHHSARTDIGMPVYDGGIRAYIGFLVNTVKARGGTTSRGTRRRKVTTAEGRVTTMAGSVEAVPGFADGAAAAARFFYPSAVAVDGNNNILVVDKCNNRIRMIAGKGGRVTTLAGNAKVGKVDCTGASVQFSWPSMTLDERGRLLVPDTYNAGSVRVMEASLAPLQRLAVEPANPPC